MFRQLLLRISQHLPSQCAVCHTWPAQAICEDCVNTFAQPLPRCQTCALAISSGTRQCGACIVKPPPLDQCFAALSYGYPWSALVSQFKFHQRPGWASAFAALMRAAPWVEPALEEADIIVPMPLSAARLQARGYNQAQVLACALDRSKVVNSVLLRVKDTAPQSSLARDERMRNAQHAYAVDPLLVHRVAGMRVVLVDDVMTSGASLYAAAGVLRGAGALSITGVVLARTE